MREQPGAYGMPEQDGQCWECWGVHAETVNVEMIHGASGETVTVPLCKPCARERGLIPATVRDGEW